MSKFYPLEPDEWLTVCEELKPAELKVLYRLRTLDPFGQHKIKFRVVDIAKALKLDKSTVSRAVQRLADLEYIDLEIVEAIATLTTKSRKLSVDNSIVPTQPDLENIRLSTDNQVVYTQPSCLQTTSAIATQPDTPQSGSGQGTDFSKISLERSRDLDRSDHDDFSKNSQFPRHLEAIASCCDQAIEKCDLKPVEQLGLTKTHEEVTNPIAGDPFRRSLEDFVISFLDIEISDEKRPAYFKKFTTEDWDKWKSKYKAANKQATSPVIHRDPVAEDPWRVENAIASMVRCKDFDAAKDRLSLVEKTNPILAKQLREKYLCS